MFRRIFLTALLAGLAAGLIAAGAQRLRIIPLIHEAEIYEAAGAAHAAYGDAAMAADEAWEPKDGFERSAYTLLADLLAGVGFAFILTGAVALAGLGGYEVDARRGLLWGLAGFAVFTLAPSLGLPPEVPGMAAADLAHRQIWWLATAFATAVGLGLVVFRSGIAWRVIGAAVLVLPHAVGAPHPQTHGGPVPPELAAQFVIASIATAGLFWLVLGGLSGWLYRRLA